ncbi:SAM-dependent methyltransferase [Colwellia sp. MT41]|uniref:class I SAM-dependent methyltransferase n=1 Tax=Colwellia sp. MT41 TaxID=58049 RepID=UPI00071762D7|nr:class I SAM-dependent methyltransferase [Colwellia sp. MT41]ALO34604.1 SAM-dependent methyltransferase [Colwellia sp. MT41]
MPAKFYNENATELSQQYLSKSFDQVHQSWRHFLPSIIANPNARILDIGAGSGRDAKHIAQLAAKTHGDENNSQVFAVEPAKLLAELGVQQTTGLKVKWLTDSLPALSTITKQEVSFDLILLSAVWMHIPLSDRARSMRKLANLLKPGGKLVISLRHSSGSEQAEQERKERKMHTVCADELKRLASDVGLFTKLATEKENDILGRDHVTWQTVVLQLPDDGTGAFPFIRHVAMNDGKSATHKLALLRVLLRIADGHPGAVLRRESGVGGDRVILPVGLVALYWCHQYKDLIDDHKLYQTPNKNPNMGFMKPDGWHKLTKLKSSDYRIGNLFSGDDAIALHKTLSAAVNNIKTMPCRYIKLPNSDNTVFEVASKTVKAKDSIFLDLQTLEQWGEFSLPESTWLAFNRYACWIEPVLVSEWVKTMASYAGNSQYKSPENQYKLHQALNWEEPKRTTVEVRKRFEQLQEHFSNKEPKQEQIRCVWSEKSLNQSYEIDHSLPFSRWPNNDLWNLLPTDSTVNNQKSDRLPTEHKLKQAKERIQHWWQVAWLNEPSASESSTSLLRTAPSASLTNNHKRFFAEANIALPGLSSDNSSVDDLFEALVMQRGRLKEMQQLREW